MMDVKWIIVHDYPTSEAIDIGAEEIRRDHMQRGWLDIAYHYVVRTNGTVQAGRPEDKPGTHCRGYNLNSLGICLVGEQAGPAQFDGLYELLMGLMDKYPDAIVIGHSDMPKVNHICPAFNVTKFMEGRSDESSYDTSGEGSGG